MIVRLTKTNRIWGSLRSSNHTYLLETYFPRTSAGRRQTLVNNWDLKTHSAGLEVQRQGMRKITTQAQGRFADSRAGVEDGLHEAGGAVIAREFPAWRKECEFAAGTGTGKPHAARQAGRRFDRRACGCKKSWLAWSRVPVPKPYCGLVGKRPSLSLTPRPVEIS